MDDCGLTVGSPQSRKHVTPILILSLEQLAQTCLSDSRGREGAQESGPNRPVKTSGS